MRQIQEMAEHVSREQKQQANVTSTTAARIAILLTNKNSTLTEADFLPFSQTEKEAQLMPSTARLLRKLLAEKRLKGRAAIAAQMTLKGS